jgi:predicted cupin superfamily sugar epimerase
MPELSASALVELLQLSPHPEGGYFRETFRSAQRVQPLDRPAGDDRAAGTAIYFLLPVETFSAWHRVQSDEAWHHYDGAPLALHTIDPAGAHTAVILGRDLAGGQCPQHVVPAGWLQAARPIASPGGAPYALCGCTVSPGFEFADFALPLRDELRAQFPELAQLIDEFTR